MGGRKNEEKRNQPIQPAGRVSITVTYKDIVTGQKDFPFVDVTDGEWYTDAVAWGAEQSIIKGYDNGNYGPNDAITREQLATILYRYAMYKGMDVTVGENTNILSYKDALDVSKYAIPAMQWACGAGIILGKDGGVLDPAGLATRAEVSMILMRFMELSK